MIFEFIEFWEPPPTRWLLPFPHWEVLDPLLLQICFCHGRNIFCWCYVLFFPCSMCLVIETKALDLLLELVPFIVLRQQLYNTGCRSLSL